MPIKVLNIQIEEFDNSDELNTSDKLLLMVARSGTANSYSPYSHFKVAASAMLANGETITGTNQENASYPVGICAERTLLSALAVTHPNEPISTIAISYLSQDGHNDTPISPCGICRQSLVEYEQRTGKNIRLILSGQQGKVVIVPSAKALLPLGFTADDLK